MNNLITGILAYSRIQSEATIPKMVNTTKLISEICCAVGLQEHQFKLTGDTVEFETDETRLEQVLLNLIGNARKYHPEPEKLEVKVTVKNKGDWIEFQVLDNGPGIDPCYHGKIFEMFQTLRPLNTTDSTGIGLAIVKKIITLYGGQTKVESQPGQGCCFTFNWPARLTEPELVEVAA